MGKSGYHGPLEQVDECCWRIPKELQGRACASRAGSSPTSG